MTTTFDDVNVDLEDDFARHWDALRAVFSEKKISDDRLKRELRLILDAGRPRPTNRADQLAVLECLNDIRASATALRQAVNSFDAAGEGLALQMSRVARRGPRMLDSEDKALQVFEVFERADKLADDLLLSCKAIGWTVGINVMPNAPIKLRHKSKIQKIEHTVQAAMKAWMKMSGLNVETAKGVIKERPRRKLKGGGYLQAERERPVKHDAYFVFLCVKMIVDDVTPSQINTAINNARKTLKSDLRSTNELVVLRRGLDAEDDLFRRKIYGLND